MLRDGEAAGGGSAKLREEKEAALLIGHVPAQAEQRKDWAKKSSREAGQEKATVQYRRRGTLRTQPLKRWQMGHRKIGNLKLPA